MANPSDFRRIAIEFVRRVFRAGTRAGEICHAPYGSDSIREGMAFREVVGHRRMLSLLSRAIARDSR